MKFSDIVKKFEAEGLGAIASSSLAQDAGCNPDIIGVASVEAAPANTLSYVESRKFLSQLQSTQASALILPEDDALQTDVSQRGIAWIVSPQPRLLFARAIALFYQPAQPDEGIHPTAVIHPTAQIGQDVSIGEHAVIRANTHIGNRVQIHPGVVVYPGATVGDRTILHANCVIHERAQLGNDCVIHSGAVIGSEGFGFVPTREGWVKMEQSGVTVLEDGVEVGCNSTIDRPAVGETRIKRNTKIDNLVQIGHNCQIGNACAIAAQVGMAGGAVLGDRVILAGQVGIANRVTVGDRTTATARAGIISDIDADSLVSGHPTVPHRQWLKMSAYQARLPELAHTLQTLQKQVEHLQHEIHRMQPDQPHSEEHHV